MSNKTLPPAADFDATPEWTAEDFARARPGRNLPADILDRRQHVRGSKFLDTQACAARLGVSLPTLASWRRLGTVPLFPKRSGGVYYRHPNVTTFEGQRDRLRSTTSDP
jgi:hypothetical protein